MKKIWLFLSLIICNSLLTWCFERNLINDTISDDIDIVNESGVVETLTLQNLKTSCEELVPDSQWITRINEKLYDNYDKLENVFCLLMMVFYQKLDDW